MVGKGRREDGGDGGEDSRPLRGKRKKDCKEDGLGETQNFVRRWEGGGCGRYVWIVYVYV